MTATILDGNLMSQQIRTEVREKIARRLKAGKQPPALATLMVGDDPGSHVYARTQQKACMDVDINCIKMIVPLEASEVEIISHIKNLNLDHHTHAILVERPLPARYNEGRVINSIFVEKDVDGMTIKNIGRLAQKWEEPFFIPNTPAAIMQLLLSYLPKIAGKHAVVLGRSQDVGIPASLLLLKADATVTTCHSHTQDLAGIARQADILVSAVGQPEMVRGDWIKPGAVVIDVGINRIPDPTSSSGHRIVGDVAFDEAKEVAAAISPVPGGVGPVTTAMLLRNTLHAAELADSR
jgi:methylenetetrahydrofolate dehydrogenase (NADP+)/methenyltetrahydrofolate cyclohydrolase